MDFRYLKTYYWSNFGWFGPDYKTKTVLQVSTDKGKTWNDVPTEETDVFISKKDMI